MALTVLCIASYHKGFEFLREAKRQGCRVLLVTSASLRDASWPHREPGRHLLRPGRQEALEPERPDSRARRISPGGSRSIGSSRSTTSTWRRPRRCASTCASAGMGETTTRYFRDKLAMRVKAAGGRAAGAGVRPRAQRRAHPRRSAGACRRRGSSSRGIRRARSASARSTARTSCGRSPKRSATSAPTSCSSSSSPATSITWTRSSTSARCSRRCRAATARRRSTSRIRAACSRRRLLDRDERRRRRNPRAQRTAARLARAGARRVAQRIHPRRDGRLVFLETSARVGGAHIAELIEAATGVNMWAEWAKIEVAGGKAPYAPPAVRAGLRRPARVAGATGIARPGGVCRSGSRVAAAEAESRRADRPIAEPRARGRAAGADTPSGSSDDFVAALPAPRDAVRLRDQGLRDQGSGTGDQGSTGSGQRMRITRS